MEWSGLRVLSGGDGRNPPGEMRTHRRHWRTEGSAGLAMAHLPPVRLRDVRPMNRFRPVRPSMLLSEEVSRVGLQILAVVHVVQERREPLLPVFSCCLTHPLQRAGRAGPARRPGHVTLARGSLDQTPSLHCLRCRFPGLVRRFLGGCGPVTNCGLPAASRTSAPRSTHHLRSRAWRTRLNTRPARTPVDASPRSSRTAAHDSGPARVATPSPCDSLIHSN
ncbi:MAG: hypothetical protein H6Q86_906 [candidate division NC10 bacterium]|nr:hypothetical protein [candidate division NC10 bacterium]